MSASTSKPRTCSDCRRPVGPLTVVFDPTTRTEVALCPVCSIAFRQRQHFSPGCCGP